MRGKQNIKKCSWEIYVVSGNLEMLKEGKTYRFYISSEAHCEK